MTINKTNKMSMDDHVQTLEFEAIRRAALGTVDVVAKCKNYLHSTNVDKQLSK